jgi:flagellar assembly protein FliH
VLKAEAVRAQRRGDGEDAMAELAPRESLEQQLIENIRTGRFATGVSAAQVEGIVRDAAREGREEGFAQGFATGEQDGFARGHAEGLAVGRGLIDDAAARLGSLLAALQQPLATQQEELREAMLVLASRIATAVVRTELRLQPETIRAVVTEALAALPLGAANIRVAVSPADLELLRNLPETPREWNLHGDPALRPGDCRVASSESVVEYAVSARLDELLAQLLGASVAESSR